VGRDEQEQSPPDENLPGDAIRVAKAICLGTDAEGTVAKIVAEELKRVPGDDLRVRFLTLLVELVGDFHRLTSHAVETDESAAEAGLAVRPPDAQDSLVFVETGRTEDKVFLTVGPTSVAMKSLAARSIAEALLADAEVVERGADARPVESGDGEGGFK
jgi:hypothetical protein